MSSFTKFRAGITAAGCAAIIFTGATYGAGLKTQKEWKEVSGSWPFSSLCSPGTNVVSLQERQTFWASPYDDQITLLEGQRGRLVSERRNWERKLAYLEERIQEREAKKPGS